MDLLFFLTDNGFCLDRAHLGIFCQKHGNREHFGIFMVPDFIQYTSLCMDLLFSLSLAKLVYSTHLRAFELFSSPQLCATVSFIPYQVRRLHINGVEALFHSSQIPAR